ncbi:hypothetical protein FFK22_020865 [Mycobacterium sp. KBS0706]|nr:hypothetical protein FFK22_020865 [Mycobacterium sp. KBS0706]
MQGAQEWPLYIPVGKATTPSVWPSYVAQFDIIVKDSQSSPQTGWVFMTLVYDAAAPGDVWDKMVPLGVQWGNDPEAKTEGATLTENWINPKAPLYSTQTLGWGGRLSGPNDGGRNDIVVDGKPIKNAPDSGCMSCHSTAQWNIDQHEMVSFLLPSFATDDPKYPGGFLLCNDKGEQDPKGSYICSPAPGSAGWMKWFQNRRGDVPMDQGSFATDFDEVFSFKSLPLWWAAVNPSGAAMAVQEGAPAQRVNQYTGAPLPQEQQVAGPSSRRALRPPGGRGPHPPAKPVANVQRFPGRPVAVAARLHRSQARNLQVPAHIGDPVMSHRSLASRLVAAGCSAVAVLSGAPPVQAQPLQISPTLPPDISSGAPTATLTEASNFAWQEFIALNWPAAQLNGVVQRGQPDIGAKFGQAGATPLVWESYRQKVEIFPGANSEAVPPHGVNGPGTSQDPYNYSDPPQYLYSGGTIPNGGVVDACPGQAPVTQPAWVNLDETSQIGLDQMYAGIVDVPATTQPNTAPQLIRFLAKANQKEYDYIVGNKLWFTTGDAYTNRIAAWQAALRDDQPPLDSGSVITLPAGTVEVKAAWRPLAKGEDSSQFHMTTVRYYEPGPGGSPCYREDQWALAGLHIIQKTMSAPYFIFATFEQAGNVVTADGVATEDANGKVVIPTAGPNTPALVYTDDPNTPTVKTNPANTFCDTPGKRLYYQEALGNPPGGTPAGGNICVDARYEPIPPVVQAANATWHGLISDYNAQNNLKSPWLYYKLVSVQAVPFNHADISTDSDSTKQIGNFYQANIVVETDYTLQQFLARIAANNAPTLYPAVNPALITRSSTKTPPLQTPPPRSPNFQNVYVAAGSHFTTYQMGGCMGCHGNAQVSGNDFSFIVGGNAFNTTPDVPAPNATKQALYLSLFGNPLPADLKK